MCSYLACCTLIETRSKLALGTAVADFKMECTTILHSSQVRSRTKHRPRAAKSSERIGRDDVTYTGNRALNRTACEDASIHREFRLY